MSHVVPDGASPWVSAAEPGSVHDLRAARIHAVPALYAGSPQGPVDAGCTDAGKGVHTPFRPHDRLLRGIRALGERAATELKQRSRAAARRDQPQSDRTRRTGRTRLQHFMEVKTAEETSLELMELK
ncbi:hypothetical protein [Streptomyces sp. GD-15H]|uniref:hypothetical protein n=1 Tax=Streptomyces sp. GD-15H TaxID=3129112 RepID=UPI003873B780